MADMAIGADTGRRNSDPTHKAIMQRPQIFRPSMMQDRSEARRRMDADRRALQPWRNWYKLAVWLRARQHRLSVEPLCRRCFGRGEIEAATIVNHIKAHRGDWSLFIDPANHESLCKHCHDTEVQREERGGTGGA